MSRSELVIGKDFKHLKEKIVVVIGAGGTGCSVIQLLSRLPLKEIIVMDGDFVEESNLERQFLYKKEDIGKRKADIIEKIQSHSTLKALPEFANEKNIPKADLIIDCTDNIESRKKINTFCNEHTTPWIYTGAVGTIGSVLFVNPGKTPVEKVFGDGESCCAIGVLHTLPAIVGAYAVTEAVRFLTTKKYSNTLFRINLSQHKHWQIYL